ncbi:MAG: FMN-binding protein [Clostridia bacterium]|nr:FMN-binding protein [Clostridia bacterium]
MQNLSAESKPRSKSDLLQLSLTLFIIAAVMALSVSLVNFITAPKIEILNKEKTDKALQEVFAEASAFEEIEYSKPTVEATDGKKVKKVTVDGVWMAKKDGENIGVCVRVNPQGYGGKIQTIVGVDLEGEIISSKIVSMSETSGIGTKIQNEDFLSQFIGQKGNLADSESIELISGATKSSKAYLCGMNAALTVASECIQEVTDVE